MRPVLCLYVRAYALARDASYVRVYVLARTPLYVASTRHVCVRVLQPVSVCVHHLRISNIHNTNEPTYFPTAQAPVCPLLHYAPTYDPTYTSQCTSHL